MAKLVIPLSPVIVKKGGEVTSDKYKGDNSSIWKKGCLLKLSSGKIAICDALDTASVLDTDDTGTSGAKLFIAMEDVDTATSDYVAVQEVTRDTIFEGRLCATGSTDPTAANVTPGTAYTAWQLTTGVWGIDVDVATKGFCVVQDTEDEELPWDENRGDDYGKVWFKLSASLFA